MDVKMKITQIFKCLCSTWFLLLVSWFPLVQSESLGVPMPPVEHQMTCLEDHHINFSIKKNEQINSPELEKYIIAVGIFEDQEVFSLVVDSKPITFIMGRNDTTKIASLFVDLKSKKSALVQFLTDEANFFADGRSRGAAQIQISTLDSNFKYNLEISRVPKPNQPNNRYVTRNFKDEVNTLWDVPVSNFPLKLGSIICLWSSILGLPPDFITSVTTITSNPTCKTHDNAPSAIVSKKEARFILPIGHKDQWDWNTEGGGTQDYQWLVDVGNNMYLKFSHMSQGQLESGHLNSLLNAGTFNAIQVTFLDGGRSTHFTDLVGVSIEPTCENVAIIVKGKKNINKIFYSRPKSVRFNIQQPSGLPGMPRNESLSVNVIYKN